MKSYPQRTRIVIIVWVLLAPALSLLYILLRSARPFIPLPLFLEIRAPLPLILMVSYLLFIPALILLHPRPVHTIILMVILTPMACIAGITILDTEFLLDSAQVTDRRYNLTVIHQIGDNQRTCLLYECEVNNLKCKRISSYYGNCWRMTDSALVVDPTTHEVNVFLQLDDPKNEYELDYTYGDQPRKYLDKLEVRGYDFYLAYFHDYGDKTIPAIFSYMLYRCIKNGISCERLPFRYDVNGRFPGGILELDQISGEIKVLIEDELIYTYGDPPRCYVKGCSITDH